MSSGSYTPESGFVPAPRDPGVELASLAEQLMYAGDSGDEGLIDPIEQRVQELLDSNPELVEVWNSQGVTRTN